MASFGSMGIATQLPTEQVREAVEGDPIRRYSVQEDKHPGIRERVWGLDARTDRSVTFEEFRYWAKIERQMEEEENRTFKETRGPRTLKNTITGRFSKGVHHDNAKRAAAAKEAGDEKSPALVGESPVAPSAPSSIAVTDAEWRTAARALRTASWGSIFFLVTTDILGWSGAPYVFATVGYATGSVLYVLFGIAAGFSGWAIWRCFLALDSSRFPMLSFGDPFLRIFGPKSRNFINVMQSIQQFMTVAVLILGQGTILSQIAQEKICYIVCFVIIMVIGMAFGMIRSLQRLSWLCNLSVWLNVASFIIICYAAVNNPIDYKVITKSTHVKTIEPVRTFAGTPPAHYQQQTPGFAASFNAIDTMVYAYSGALLFVAFLAEMRHPMDFWKGLFIAQVFICVIYLFFGVFVYSFWGQYSANNIGQVVTPYSLQTVGNAFGLITGFIAIILYFNIGMKTVYLEVFQEVCHFPPIVTKRGKMLWYALGPFYWILAFIVAAAVPNLNGVVAFVGGLFGLNFTYSIPGIMYAGFKIQDGASLPGEGFDPITGQTIRHDAGLKRWWRGYCKTWMISTPVILYVLAGLACSGMGVWAAVEGLISIFGPGGTVATSFGCAVPV